MLPSQSRLFGKFTKTLGSRNTAGVAAVCGDNRGTTDRGPKVGSTLAKLTRSIGTLVVAAAVVFSLMPSAEAGNTATGTVRMGVILVPTVQTVSQPTQALQFPMGSSAIFRLAPLDPGMNCQVSELDLVIGQDQARAARSGSGAVVTAPQSQSTAKLIQTTFVAD